MDIKILNVVLASFCNGATIENESISFSELKQFIDKNKDCKAISTDFIFNKIRSIALHLMDETKELKSYKLSRGTTKGELATKLYKGLCFDYALPKNWIDKAQFIWNVNYPDQPVNIAAFFVWHYPDGNKCPHPLPLYSEAVDLLALLALKE